MVKSPLLRALALTSGALLTTGLAAGAAEASTAHHHNSGPVVVVSGLNNPRQLALLGHGRQLLIAEAGKGGSVEIQGPEGPTFVGTTGSISSVSWPRFAHNRRPNRIVTGLLSGAAQDGSQAVGSDGVTARAPYGRMYIQETFFPPDGLPQPATNHQDGWLLKARAHGHVSRVADITGFEAANDPDGKGVDSDPYTVLALPGSLLVADAAANDILRVRHGKVRVFHVFPNVTTGACASQFDPTPDFPGCNFVPTSLATDRWGHVFVGGLSSLTPNEAQVVELGRWGHRVLHVWKGFTAVTGLAVGRDGSLYVSQLFAPEQNPPNPQIAGVLTRIDRWGHRTNMDVPFPAGIAIGHGAVYVSAFSIAPETGLGVPGTSGQVWRVHFPHHD